MYRLMIFGVLLTFASANAYAELRVIGIHVVKSNVAGAKVSVSIYSDVKKEDRRKLKIKDAAKIMKDAVGWGSSIRVGVVAHDIPLADYLPLLQAISENHWAELAFVECRKPSFVDENIRRIVRNAIKQEKEADDDK